MADLTPPDKAAPKSSGCPTCCRNIVFTAYFDRFGFSADENEKNLTNIGLLFEQLSFRNNVEITKEIGSPITTWHYKRYISGLGTPYRPEDILKTGTSLVLGSIPDSAKDGVKEEGKELGEKFLKSKASTLRGGLSDVLKKETGMSVSGWRKNWQKYRAHRSVLAEASGFSAKQVKTATRMAGKHIDDAVKGVGRFGLSAAKVVTKEVLQAIVFGALEATPASDWKWAAKAFTSGGKKRVDDAWGALKAVIQKERDNIKPPSQTCCGEVRVFIFGADWGGTLARMFAKNISDKCDKKGGMLQFEGIPIRLCFVGLFDCANSWSNKKGLKSAGEMLEYIPTPASWIRPSLDDDDLAMPEETEEVFHLYAAHERGYLVSSIAGGGRNKVEEALPGISTDVCGGALREDEYGLANLEIAKYALCQMHAVAKAAGAPFASPDDDTDQAKALDEALAPSFPLNGNDIHTFMPQYLAAIGTEGLPPEEAVARSCEAYVKWLRTIYDGSDKGRSLQDELQKNPLTKDGRPEFLKAMTTQVRNADYEARRGQQLVDRSREHQLGKLWLSGEHLDNPIIHGMFTAFAHFDYPCLPLSFREVDS